MIVTHWWHRGRVRCGARHGATSVALENVTCPRCQFLRMGGGQKTTGGLVPPESKDSMATKKKAAATNGEPERLEIKVPLQPEIIQHRRVRCVETQAKLQKVTAKKDEVSKEYRAKEKELKKEIKELLEEIDTGLQTLTVEVREEPQIRTVSMIKRRVDTGEVVFERAMTTAEHKQFAQVTLDEVLAAKDAGEQVAAKANGKANGHSKANGKAKPAKAPKAPKAAKAKKGPTKTREEIEANEGGLF